MEQAHLRSRSRVLVVEDDPETLTTFAALLNQAGHDVVQASTANQAIHILGSVRVDLAVVDLRLPDATGIEVMRRARAKRVSVPFVVISGFGTVADVVKSMQMGAATFLEKPITEETLVDTVDCLLDSSQRMLCSQRRTEDTVVQPLRRLTSAIIAALHAVEDPRTLADWSRYACVSPGTIRGWCSAAGLRPRYVLAFSRVLRAICISIREGRRMADSLDVVDVRTLRNLLRATGFHNYRDVPHTIHGYLEQQTVIRDRTCLATIEDYVRLNSDRR